MAALTCTGELTTAQFLDQDDGEIAQTVE
jgi:hypothetical protein